jgi:hypothetical protein
MADDKINPATGVRGTVTLWRVDETTGLKTPICTQRNQIQYAWGYIAAKQFGYRPNSERPSYHISTLYVEFENQSNPAVDISVAPFSRTVDVAYYGSLSGNRDYLRLPIVIEPTLGVSTGYEANLPINQSANQLTFFVQTSGNTGVHGLNFASNANSKVYAAALVASPDFGDPTKDVVFARTMFSAGNQVIKEASSQIGITWDIAFE